MIIFYLQLGFLLAKRTFMKSSKMWLSAEMGRSVQPGEIEEEGYLSGFKCIAGVDEVGRGPLAGPVVAAAVILPRGVYHSEMKDSKLLSPNKREKLAAWIKKSAIAWELGVVGPEEIDRINILKASLLAMALAYRHLDPVPDYLLIDGPQKIPVEFLKDEVRRIRDERGVDFNSASRLPTPAFPSQRAIKKGDRLSHSIAAASIVAKVTRDQIMVEYDRIFPEYGFGQHKGYGSPIHLSALSRYGPSPIHRKSFKPVRDHLLNGKKFPQINPPREG